MDETPEMSALLDAVMRMVIYTVKHHPPDHIQPFNVMPYGYSWEAEEKYRADVAKALNDVIVKQRGPSGGTR